MIIIFNQIVWFKAPFTQLPLLSFCFAFIFFVQVSASAQDGGDTFSGNRGFNIIEGRVFYPSGRPVNKRLKITLQSVYVAEGFTLSNEQGEFRFRRLPEGTYRITIDAGKDYEIQNETVDVIGRMRRRGDQTEVIWPVTVFLKLKTSSVDPNAVVNAALANTPKPALELYEKAGQAAKQGDKQKAIDLLEQAIKVYPQFAEAYKELGFLYLSSKNGEKAISAFKEAVKITADNFSYQLNLGYALLEFGKFSEAREELIRAVALNRESTSALVLLARVQLTLKDYDEAEKNLLAAANLGGADAGTAYKILSALYEEKGNLPKSAEALERYLGLPSNDRDAAVLIKLSRAQIKLRKLNEAEKNLLKAVSIGGKEVSMAHRFLGALFIEKGDLNRAIEHLEKYLELAPTAKDVTQIRSMVDDLRRRTIK